MGLKEDICFKLRKNRNKIARFKYAYEVTQKLLMGAKQAEVIRWLNEIGFPATKKTVQLFRRDCIGALTIDERKDIIQDGKARDAVNGLEPDEEVDFGRRPTEYLLVELVRVVCGRIRQLKGAKVVDSDHDTLLINYAKLASQLRQDLAKEQRESDVALTRDRTIEDVAKISIEFIPDDKKDSYIKKIEEYETQQGQLPS